MRGFPLRSRPLALVTIFCLLGMFSKTGLALKCYVCTGESDNEQCNKEEHVVNCPDVSPPGMEYDVCQTIVRHSDGADGDGMTIEKQCKAGPCSLDNDQNKALSLDCDRSGSQWQCESCCKTDRCNKDDGSAISHSKLLLMISATCALFASLRLQM